MVKILANDCKPEALPLLTSSDYVIKSSSGPWLSLGLIAGYFLLLMVLVGPQGDFPINDDWIYGEAVRLSVADGQLRLGASCSTCFLHILLGTLVCKLVGFSYSVLHVLNLCLGLLAALFVYGTVRELGLNRKYAALSAFMLSCNPIFVILCFSFMTDVTAMAFINGYLYFMVRGLKRDAPTSLYIAALLFMAALAVRQPYIVFVACNALVLVYMWAKRRHSWGLLLGLVILPVVETWCLENALVSVVQYQEGYKWFEAEFTRIISDIFRKPFKSIYTFTLAFGKMGFYLGLFCIPVLCAFTFLLKQLFQAEAKLASIWFVLSGGMVATTLTTLAVLEQKWMPFNQNLLRIPTLGALGIMGVSLPALGSRWRQWLTYLSGFFAFLLLALLGAGLFRSLLIAVRSIRRAWRSQIAGQQPDFKRNGTGAVTHLFCFTAVVVIAVMGSLQIQVVDLDRYYIMPLVPVLLCLGVLCRWQRVRVNWAISFALAGLVGIYSLCASQDYMSWNRARWRGLKTLEAMGTSPKEIDGGAEYNFLRHPDLQNALILKGTQHYFIERGEAPRDSWRWWPVRGESFIVSFSQIPGYEIVRREPYFSFLTFSTREVLILQQAGSS